MASFLDLGDDDWELRAEISKRSKTLFKPSEQEPQLQLSRLFKSGNATASEAMSFEKNLVVQDASQLTGFKAESNDLLQVFVIRQERSWKPLYISRELFEDFVATYAVFSPFWKCMFTFGTKSNEDECDFPGFMSRGPSRKPGQQSIESAYVIRRAELNHRALSEGQKPWSIRQSAVYHRYCSQKNDPYGRTVASTSPKLISTLLLVSPSKSIDQKVGLVLEKAFTEEEAANPCVMHSLIMADSMKGWLGYISWLEKEVKDISTPIIYADLESEDDECSDGFSFKVDDRQGIKTVEDKVIDLQIILSTLQSTIEGIRKYCQKCCEMSCQKMDSGSCICASALDEFDGYIKEVKLCLERANILKERVFSTAQLLSDLLRYEDQKALKDLTKQSQQENHMMCSFAEKSTKDAEAVKVLTIIGLVYLPTTFVANFFSTEFVRTDESGNMSVNPNTWLLAAFALPLTILTITTWWLCVKYKLSQASFDKLKSLFAKREGRGWELRWRRQNEPSVDDGEKQGVPLDKRFGTTARTWSTGKSTLV